MLPIHQIRITPLKEIWESPRVKENLNSDHFIGWMLKYFQRCFAFSEIKYSIKWFPLFDNFTSFHECTAWSRANHSNLLCFRDLGSRIELGLHRGSFQYWLVELMFLIHRAVRMNYLKLEIHLLSLRASTTLTETEVLQGESLFSVITTSHNTLQKASSFL